MNARRAVDLAIPRPRNSVLVSRRFDAPIPDLHTVQFSLDVAESTPVSAVSISVDIQHTYIGDLVVTLIPPSSTGLVDVVLENKTGGSRRNISKTYDAASVPAILQLAGKDCAGTWPLKIEDTAREDFGTLVSFGLELFFPHTNSRIVAAPKVADQVPVPESVSRSTRPASVKRKRAKRTRRTEQASFENNLLFGRSM